MGDGGAAAEAQLFALCGTFAAQSDDQLAPPKAPAQRKTKAAPKKSASARKPAAKKAAGN